MKTIAAIVLAAVCFPALQAAPAKKTIVLIHGLYVTRSSWDPWIKYFEAKGYRVIAPGYPGLEGDAAAIRAKHPDPALAALTLTAVTEHYRTVLRGLEEKPIVVGHSMGGLIAQILLNEGLAAKAVGICSAPPVGVVSPATAGFRHGFRFVRNNWDFVTPFASDDEPSFMSLEKFKSEFANGIPDAEAAKLYEILNVPASRRQGKEALKDAAKVDFAKARGPLLLIAGLEDHIIPPSVVRANHAEYEASAGRTDLREFPGRGHFLPAQAGWEETAAAILAWIEQP